MRRIAFISCVVLAVIVASAQQYNVPFRPRAAAGGAQPSQVGTMLEFDITTTDNVGTVSSTITVPALTTFVIVGVSSYAGSANYYSGGSMTMTKGASDTAMTVAITGTGSGDESDTTWAAAMFYMVAPDVGTDMSLKWDWAGTGLSSQGNKVSVTFWKDVNQSTPVRGAAGGQGGANTPYTTSTITAASGDLIVAWAGAFSGTEGTCASWTNATLLTQITKHASSDNDGAWATASPTGNQTVACATDTNWDDGGIVAVSLTPN